MDSMVSRGAGRLGTWCGLLWLGAVSAPAWAQSTGETVAASADEAAPPSALPEEGEVVCPDDPRRALVDAAAGVQDAYGDLDPQAFDVARSRMDRLYSCVTGPLSLQDSLALHRARALIAYVDEDLEASKRSFAAIHHLDPGWAPPPALVPPSHPIWNVFETSVDDDGDPRMLGLTLTPPGGWAVDGTRYPEEDAARGPDGELLDDYGLPADRAFVLQVFRDDGSMLYTGYHISPADIPVEEMAVLPDPKALRKRRRASARLWGTVISSTLLGASGVTLGLGLADRTAMQRGDVPLEDVTAVQSRANTLGYTSAGLAGAGGALMAVTWAVPW